MTTAKMYEYAFAEGHDLRYISHHAQVKNDTVVEVWLPKWQAELAKVTAMGYRALLASTFYLSQVATPQKQDWKSYYNVDPQGFNGKNRSVGFSNKVQQISS